MLSTNQRNKKIYETITEKLKLDKRSDFREAIDAFTHKRFFLAATLFSILIDQENATSEEKWLGYYFRHCVYREIFNLYSQIEKRIEYKELELMDHFKREEISWTLPGFEIKTSITEDFPETEEQLAQSGEETSSDSIKADVVDNSPETEEESDEQPASSPKPKKVKKTKAQLKQETKYRHMLSLFNKGKSLMNANDCKGAIVKFQDAIKTGLATFEVYIKCLRAYAALDLNEEIMRTTDDILKKFTPDELGKEFMCEVHLVSAQTAYIVNTSLEGYELSLQHYESAIPYVTPGTEEVTAIERGKLSIYYGKMKHYAREVSCTQGEQKLLAQQNMLDQARLLYDGFTQYFASIPPDLLLPLERVCDIQTFAEAATILGHHDFAIEKFKEVIRLTVVEDVFANEAHFKLGQIYSSQGNYEKAIETYLRLVPVCFRLNKFTEEQRVTLSKACYRVAISAEHLNDLQGALTYFTMATALFESVPAILGLDYLLNSTFVDNPGSTILRIDHKNKPGGDVAALRQLNEFMTGVEDPLISSYMWVMKAIYYYNIDAWQNAYDCFQDARERYSLTLLAQHYFEKVKINLEAQDNPSALEKLQSLPVHWQSRAPRLFSTQEELLKHLPGTTPPELFTCSEFEKMKQSSRELVKIINREEGKEKEKEVVEYALAACTAFARYFGPEPKLSSPKDARDYLSYAISGYFAKDYALAERCLQTILDGGFPDMETCVNEKLASLYAAQHQFDKAIETYQKIVPVRFLFDLVSNDHCREYGYNLFRLAVCMAHAGDLESAFSLVHYAALLSRHGGRMNVGAALASACLLSSGDITPQSMKNRNLLYPVSMEEKDMPAIYKAQRSQFERNLEIILLEVDEFLSVVDEPFLFAYMLELKAAVYAKNKRLPETIACYKEANDRFGLTPRGQKKLEQAEKLLQMKASVSAINKFGITAVSVAEEKPVSQSEEALSL